MIITCNKQIVDIRYSGHTISKVYACGGELVYDKDSGSTDSYMVMVRSETSSGDLTAYEPCNSSSAATNQIWVAEGSGTIINKEDVNVMWIGECAIEIGEGAFQNYTHLRLIPNSGANVRIINDYGFSQCIALERIYFGCNLEEIGAFAFYNCSSLNNVTFCYSDTNVTSIGSNAFANCTSLSSVRLPRSLTTLGRNAFNGCTSLSTVYVDAVTPPSLPSQSGAFDNCADNLRIIVPQASYEAYRKATGWTEYVNRIYTS